MTAQLGDAAANPVFTDVLSQGQSLGSINAQSLVQLRGQATITVQVTAIGTLTLSFEATVDGTNFFPVNMYPVAGGAAITTTTVNGQWTAVIAGAYQFRTRVSAYTSGTALVSSNASQGTNEQAIQTGTAQGGVSAGLIGQLVQGNVTTANPTYTTGNTNPLSLTTTGAVRAAITGNAGAAIDAVSGAATPANGVLVGGGSVAGGTNLTPITVKAASIAATATDTSVVVQPLVGNAVMGTVAAGVQKVGIVGNANAAIDSAIGAAPPANAVQIAPKAATANPTNATAGNAVALMADKAGRLVSTPGNVRELIGNQSTVITASTAENTIITAGGAGVFNDISALIITTSNTAASVVTIKDATAGTTRLTLHYPSDTQVTVAPVEPLIINFSPPITQAAAAANWTATCSVNAGAYAFNCVYVKNL